MPCDRKRSTYAVVIILAALATVCAFLTGFEHRVYRDDISLSDLATPGSRVGQYVVDQPLGIELTKRKGFEDKYGSPLVLQFEQLDSWVHEENVSRWWKNVWPAIGIGLLYAGITYVVTLLAMAVVWFLWWFFMHRLADIGRAWRGEI